LIASHHFPPRYVAGAEQYAYRLVKWLIQNGHEAKVVYVDSVDYGNSPEPTCAEDNYDGIPVCRLRFNLDTVPDPFGWSYWNPAIGEWFEQFLVDYRPDLVHINSGYLLSASPVEAVKRLALPVVLTLHDYWFLCPYVGLLHPDGTLCPGPSEAIQCVWCMMTERRRYRLPDSLLQGKLGSAVTYLSRHTPMRWLPGFNRRLEAMRDRRARVKHAFQRADVVVGLSRFLCDKHTEYGLQPRRMVFIGFGMEPRTQAAATERAGPGLRIGYLGQLAPHKGIDTLVKAFNQLSSSRDSLYLEFHGGFGHCIGYEAEIRRLAAANPAIKFFGPYDNRRVGKILSGLDVVVVPSVWYENRPTVILEALAAKTPVIGSAIGGIPELITHGVNGLLFEAGTPSDLANQLRRLLDEPSLLSRLCNSIQPVKTIEEEMAELMQVYESLVGEHKAE
jgi:glycosyltransferase involved in cell wall biosynthesis